MPKFELSVATAWILLILAGLIEIGWAVGMKYSEGFTKLWPSVITISAMAISFLMLAMALNKIPISVGYAIWTGIGGAGTAIIGMYVLDEPKSALKILCVLLIVAGIVGLKLVSPAQPDATSEPQSDHPTSTNS